MGVMSSCVSYWRTRTGAWAVSSWWSWRRCALRLLVVVIFITMATTDGGVEASSASYAALSAAQVHAMLSGLYRSGRLVELEQVAQQVIHENPTVVQDLRYPSAFQYLGVAQYALGDLAKATKTFELAVQANDDDRMSWVQLGCCYLYQMQLTKAEAALTIAIQQKGLVSETHRLFKARNWMADWQDRDEMLAQIVTTVEEELRRGERTGANALDFAQLPPRMVLGMSRQLQLTAYATEDRAQDAPPVTTNHARKRPPTSLDSSQALPLNSSWRLRSQELRVGFVSSDFGVHPVATLMRGMLALLATEEQYAVHVYCFSLTTATSWWKRNITRTVNHMISLSGKDPAEAAEIIRSHALHVVIDLNGYTLHSGLPILRHRPAPVQLAFLGYPMTTGAPFIDYFITDAVSTPVETSNAFFTEKLLLLSTHYIVNDHMQMLGHTLTGPRPRLRDLLPSLLSSALNDSTTFVFATFSNWQKMDPAVFASWMTILARVPQSVMWFLEYSAHTEAAQNLRREALAHGVDGDRRLVFSPMSPWINHTYVKRRADLVLDTSLKNGHTTLLDALCAGVPVLTLEGRHMSNRAGSSALSALLLRDVLVVNSFKEYVEVAVRLATAPTTTSSRNSDASGRGSALLTRLRRVVEERRLRYPLFDTKRFTGRFAAALRSAWLVSKTHRHDERVMHVFPAAVDSTPHEFPILSALDDHHTVDEYEQRVQETLQSSDQANSSGILLHIGGQTARTGWWIVDANDGLDVDFVLHMDNLYAFPEDSVTAIYASHVLEHVHYGVDKGVQRTLREWHRVLRPGGALYVAVPDLAVLSALFVNETLSEQDRFFVMRMMFGGQIDAFDVHKVGFNAAFLTSYLQEAGFCQIERVREFGLFVDSSMAEFHGTPISLNIMARACKPGDWVDVALGPIEK